MPADLPATITSDEHLEDLLSEPTDAVLSALEATAGDIILLGAAGKMGFSLAHMLRRASDQRGDRRRILAVSRFSRPGQLESFQKHDIETCAGDLLDEAFLHGLPPMPNVVFMTGMKFGTGHQASQTWAMNVYLPALVCRQFPGSRILAFSTGNVYPFVPIHSGGSVELDRLDPVGEYGMSALGRERMFEYFSLRDHLSVAIVRLNYAVEMRYGVLVDLAHQINAGQPIDLAMGYANVIWQGDANAHAICALADASSPPFVINIAGPELLDVRHVCEQLSNRLGRPAKFINEPAQNALLNNASQAHARYGRPRVSLAQMIDWVADWVQRGGTSWHKPTHFQTRDGRF